MKMALKSVSLEIVNSDDEERNCRKDKNQLHSKVNQRRRLIT